MAVYDENDDFLGAKTIRYGKKPKNSLSNMPIPGWEPQPNSGMYGRNTQATQPTQAIPTAAASSTRSSTPFRFNTPEPAIQMRRPDTASDATRRIARAQNWDAENNVPMFDNRSIKAGGYDRPEIRDLNVVPKEQFGAMLSTAMNPKGDQNTSAALRAAAARGDWNAVGRYYASQGEPFAGKMYDGGGQLSDLYRMAMGGDGQIVATKKRDRAADMYKNAITSQTALASQQLQNAGYMGTQRLSNEGAMAREKLKSSAEAERDKARYAFEGPLKEKDLTWRQNQLAEQSRLNDLNAQRYAAASLANLLATGNPQFLERYGPKLDTALTSLSGVMTPEMEEEWKKMQAEQAAAGKANGGLVEGYAKGGQVQPVLNPMGNMGMPSSMADLDPVIRQYAQYVSTASQYGLQPVAFPKFIDLLGAARTQLSSLPTQAGTVGMADGGPVSTNEDDMYYVKQFDENGNFTGYTAYPRQQMPNDSAGRPSWVPQETWDKNNPNKKYADGGVVDWLKGLVGYPQQAPNPTPQTTQQRFGQGAAMLGQGMVGQAGQALQGRNAALEAALREAQGARGYAGGGAIPVAGQQVMGAGGPKSDSIPAVIDGSRPAALSSGEFVMPVEVVRFFGTDKLNKMIQQARGVK